MLEGRRCGGPKYASSGIITLSLSKPPSLAARSASSLVRGSLEASDLLPGGGQSSSKPRVLVARGSATAILSLTVWPFRRSDEPPPYRKLPFSSVSLLLVRRDLRTKRRRGWRAL